ncbi:hypothetical protein HPB48_014768 [Haemaphysalis longicornis]|uniref:YqaJ viral recombinase domain-containing protein n=1 Tax=Haemaphysalis longicornis TaxID=44386 RepID=A0A9J6FMI6_HAELO|nr:hypothetical protein HPB48_014768 [Haemaphysalis longicornis]
MKPDTTPEEFAEKVERQLNELRVDEEACEQIEAQTRGQADNPNWFEHRRLRLKASNSHAVCVRKHSTPCDALVKTLLHPRCFTNAATEPRKQHGECLLSSYMQQTKRDVQPCGLFVDLEHGFLAASPDGVVGKDRIVEVKCLLTSKGAEPMEAARTFAEKKEKDGDPGDSFVSPEGISATSWCTQPREYMCKRYFGMTFSGQQKWSHSCCDSTQTAFFQKL